MKNYQANLWKMADFDGPYCKYKSSHNGELYLRNYVFLD